MGNSNSENLNKEQILSQLKYELHNLQCLIKNYISHNEEKNSILNYIDKAFQKSIHDFERKLLNLKTFNINSINTEESQNENFNGSKQIKNNSLEIDEIKKYDYFIRKDIQIENLAITRDFEENKYINYCRDDEEIENESIAHFLYEIANISRLALNESNKFLEILYNKYDEKKQRTTKNEVITITTLDQFKKEFSSWVKANNDYVNEFLNDYLNKQNLSYINSLQDKEYFKKLYRDLISLYFHCELSIPRVEVSFDTDNTKIFNSQKMLDILNKGSDRKVNFIFLPSLYSNGNYIENGKQWAFTYINGPKKKKTFYFDEKKLNFVQIDNNKFSIPTLSDKLKLIIKPTNYLVPKLNYNISD